MKYFLDTEFIEYPCTIDLVSIGLVSEDNRKLYLVSNEYDASKANDFVKNNVLTKLDKQNAEILSNKKIAQRVIEFVGDDKNPDFYGYYCDYDWVVFCWLFGSMSGLPYFFPKYCRDIKYLADLKNIKIPIQTGENHNALNDALWIKEAYEFIESFT